MIYIQIHIQIQVCCNNETGEEKGERRKGGRDRQTQEVRVCQEMD